MALLTATLTVIALVIGGGSFYVIRGLQALNSIPRYAGLMPTDSTPVTITDDQPVNLVLIGSDSRAEDDKGRSDTLMLVHINVARNKIYLISIPRDSYVEVPGYGKRKVNAAYTYGGAALSVKTVENLLDVQVAHNAVIDFTGFIGLTGEIGGITVDNQISSSSRGYDFPLGEIHLDKEQALAYVRERYDLPGGDFDRAARQRTVVSALIRKLMTPTTLANPVVFNSLADRIGSFLTLDAGLTNDVLWQVANSMNIHSETDIRGIQLPIARFSKSPTGASIDIVDTKRLAELTEALKADQLQNYWQQYGDA